jgi:predicted amidohydrolase
MRSPLRIALGQVALEMGNKAANCRALLEAIDEAASRECDLIVLPECALVGWLSNAARDLAEPIPGPFIDVLRQKAIERRIAIAAGLEERDGSSIYNAAVFISEDGALLAKHRKIFELDFAGSLYATGQALQVFAWREHVLGLLICADCWRPEAVDALHAMGANLILSPCAWAVDPGGESTNLAWIVHTYHQRVGRRDLTIAAANSVGAVSDGPWARRILQGNSLVISDVRQMIGKTGEPDLLICELP